MLTISIVLYNTPERMLDKALNCLLKSDLVSGIFIIDNSPLPRKQILGADICDATLDPRISYQFLDENSGYSKGHNTILNNTSKRDKYHLVMNADIHFVPGTLEKIVEYMECNSEIGLIMPKILNPDGTIQKQAKLLPTPLNLIARRFLPKFIAKKLDEKFELHCYKYQHAQEIPYLNGSFMFLRSSELDRIGGFEEKIFMYGEDLDLARRFYMQSKSVVFPHVEVTHEHQKASFKKLKPLIFHIKGVCAYFNKWGWLFDHSRKKINKQVLRNINESQQA